jgi:DNA-binding HxlR family transcriptional regulator
MATHVKTDAAPRAEHPRFQYDLQACGLQRALDVLGEKWTLLVLREAMYGLRRFDDFARALTCGRGVLSARLKTLTDAGVLERREYAEPGQRPRPEYLLTEKGRALYPAILALTQWSDRWAPHPYGPASLVVDRHSGKPVSVVLSSDSSARTLSMDDVRIGPGPGAKRLPSGARRGKSTYKQEPR